jgi:hypothetical protein
VAIILNLLLVLVTIVSTWQILRKAGRPGWAALLPIYNIVLLFRIADRPAWQALALVVGGSVSRLVVRAFAPGLLPLAISMLLLGLSFGLWLLFGYSLAQKFGKSSGFGLGTIFLPFIFLPILAFGRAEYNRSENTVPAVLGLG